MMKRLVLAGLVLSALVAPVFAVNDGTAVGVNPDAVVRINSADRVLMAGDGISVGETLVTGHSGQVQIIFADDTHLVVGPDSKLLIETYLMRNNGTAEKLAINALAGSFRFITGHSPKPAYQINTPTAAIAVRGTKFDIVVTDTDTRVMLYEGALQLCGSGSDCVRTLRSGHRVSKQCRSLYARRSEADAAIAEFSLRALPDPVDGRVSGQRSRAMHRRASGALDS
jgi:hypothetical protein